MVLTAEQAHARRWWTLAVLCLSLTVISIDNTILNVALPKIVESVNATGSQLQWLVDAYVIVFACLLLTSGSLGDKFGRKKVLTAGLFLFGLFSGLAAFSGSAWSLIIFRGLQGIGGACIFPSTLSILTNTFTDPKERGRAIGIWAGVSGLGIAVGPLLGGTLLLHFWWGSVFLVNVPICAAAIVLGRFFVPEVGERDTTKLDPAGAVLSIVGLLGLLFAIIEAPDKGWTSPVVLIGGAIGLTFLGAFAWWEYRTPHAMLDVKFFRNPRFSAASATITLTYFALFGSTFLLTQYFQFVLLYSPLKAGMLTAPVAVGIMLIAPRAPRLVERIGTKRVVVLGLTIMAGVLLTYASDTIMSSLLGGSLTRFCFGIGIGFVVAPATESIMGSLPREKAGVGSAVNDTTRQTGGSLGVAVIGSIFALRYHSAIAIPSGVPGPYRADVRDSIGKALKAMQDWLTTGGRPTSQRLAVASEVHQAASHAFLTGMRTAVITGACILALAITVAVRYLPARAADDPGLAPEVPVATPEADLVGA
jgi:EmrB/QacA subfamily drug resistance transporter